MNDTFRANVVFGLEYDEEFFWKVIDACALTEDLRSLPDSDLTVIGDRGINISGGQRARLSLARAVYSRADIYILDDPLSAVDAHVKRHILDNVLLAKGILGDKLRIIATHIETILPYCDQVVTVDDGRISTVTQMARPHEPKQPVPVPSSPTDSEASGTLSPTSTCGDGNDSDSMAQTPLEPEHRKPENKSTADEDEDTPLKRNWTNWENYTYVAKLCGASTIALLVFSAILDPISEFVSEGYQLDALKENSRASGANNDAVLLYMRVGIYKSISWELLWRFRSYVKKMVGEDRLARSIRSIFISHLIHAPLSFFDSTPRQHVSNAYYDGPQTIGEEIPRFVVNEVSDMLSTVLSLYRVLSTSPQLLIVSPVVTWLLSKSSASFILLSKFIQTSRRDVDIVYSRVRDVIYGGKKMIRVFGVESHFTNIYTESSDESDRITRASIDISKYRGIMSNLIRYAGDVLVTWSVILQSQFTRHGVSSAEYITNKDLVCTLIHNIGGIMRLPERIEDFADKIDHYRQFVDLAPEAPYIIENCRPSEHWPQRGSVEFRNYTMRYHKDLDPVLKNINLTIHPGEKIGIVGRTGAGKSTLVKALFRLVHNTSEGSILIDGEDISKFGVGDLRPRLGVIPQESTIFDGSFADNLDPLDEFTLEDMWATLIKCDIASFVQPARKQKSDGYSSDEEESNAEWLEEQKEYNGRWSSSGWMMRLFLLAFDEKPKKPVRKRNRKRLHGLQRNVYSGIGGFSNGQQQLFSMCRMLLRKRKILILDEATAEVDLKTDQRLQKLIRSEFGDCTVLTIAHRLDTVKNSDRIIVMDRGEIVEVGPPQELMEKGGHFAELVRTSDF
ncbi:hypothetical protein LPJ73_002720 [Coemansia sp. RSA 2703]|nr:hypothetical protein LPJ73_002720 [Coemansia sp. RSA 2703]